MVLSTTSKTKVFGRKVKNHKKPTRNWNQPLIPILEILKPRFQLRLDLYNYVIQCLQQFDFSCRKSQKQKIYCKAANSIGTKVYNLHLSIWPKAQSILVSGQKRDMKVLCKIRRLAIWWEAWTTNPKLKNNLVPY